MNIDFIEDASFNNTNVKTNIGILHEKGHKEPWIIAMDCKPTKARVLDYGMKWGIEAMFFDFKTRGYGITKTHLRHEDRIERLILILSTGMEPREVEEKMSKKKERSIVSYFKRGIRMLIEAVMFLSKIPKLWININRKRKKAKICDAKNLKKVRDI